MEHKRLGELLLDHGLIDKKDLNQALKEQKINGKLLGAILVEKGLITNEKLSEILELQQKIKTVSLSRVEVSSSAVKLIPERLAKRFLSLAISKKENFLKVVMADPKDIIAIDTIRSITGYNIIPMKGKGEEIITAIEKYYYGFLDDKELLLGSAEVEREEEKEEAEVKFQANDPPIIKYVNLLLIEAIEKRASDIHLEIKEKGCSLRFRIDGVLQVGTPPSPEKYSGVVSRIKILSNLDIAERRLPQDGRFRIKIGNKSLDLRVSTFPTIFGEKAVIRILDRSNLILSLQELGMETQQLTAFQNSLRKPHGIILVTGPTGSGKTTTLYAGLSYLNNPAKNIVTVEEPVEYELEGINQTQARPEIGLTFARYLRHIVRQDPDIIMIGEIRDFETAEIAIRSALTGHLVLSTLHTNDSISTILRLVDMGIKPYLLPPSLNLIIAQRLVRRLCPECKERAPAPDFLPPGTKCYRPKGCPFCNETGYWGRIGIYETLEMTPELKRVIAKGADGDALRKEAKRQGMKTLFDSGLSKLTQGITSLEEVLSVAEKNED